MRLVETLREALTAVGVQPPYLVAGHSLGGLYANLYARLYPKLHGIQSRIEPGEPAMTDVSKMSNAELKERGISWVPRSLPEAIGYLAEDTILAETIGRSIWEEFINIKRTESDKFNRYVSDWERKLFANLF